MTDFIRARSSEQKAQRLEEIKQATEKQFAERPYHEITLTTIANDLGWSRANLYKYVTTKEEIFLSLTADKARAYCDALLTALPEGCDFSTEVIAEVWAGIANAHQEYFRYGDLLFTIVETNVEVEKLAEFKRAYYDSIAQLKEHLAPLLGISADGMEMLFNSIYYHAVGLCGWCQSNPLVKEALDSIGVTPRPVDFKAEMRDFICMMLKWYQAK